ncbi:hypothetical protein IX27_31175 [Streptomyces sp. JS01]|uniref:hypothetical protein n=1 Tax=Streptomyces TaxID=1883 RepID=UPI0005059EA9|nr:MULTISPECIES: hypothetical protein [unclassified Streptomyces]KFK85986.1 hypothetical protein IX27_31175 [Streptomyces sp. JS01]
MTRTPNDGTDAAAGTGLPKGAGPIDTGTPVRRPGTPDPATRTVTGKETDPVRPPTQAPGSAGHAEGAQETSVGGTPHTPDPTAVRPPDPRTAPGETGPEAGPDSVGRPSGEGPGLGKPLFAPAEQEAFAARIQQAVTGFVEDPHRAVRDADATFEEVVADLGAALAERGRRLRSGKDGSGGDSGADTEDLRIALQHYRDLTERLVRL